MEDGRRRAYIKYQAAARKKEGIGLSNPSTKRKPLDKTNRPPKKPKVTVRSIGVTPTETKLPPTPPVHGKGKGSMTSQGPADEKCPVLLHEDPQFALKQLNSIITSEDYEDLGNHSIEAIEEMGLFSLALICISLSFLSIMLFVYSL